MIVMNLKIDNFLLFSNFSVNMSYPKKPVKTRIPEENLALRPNFRYKKLIVLMGANATGKTALGRVLMGLFNFIDKKEYHHITKLINNKFQPASYEMDFVPDGENLYRIRVEISPLNENETSYSSKNISVSVVSQKIFTTDNYERCVERLEAKDIKLSEEYIIELEKIPRLSWSFKYPFAMDGKQQGVKPVNPGLYKLCLKHVLQILDPRIKDVERVPKTDNSYAIIRDNDTIPLINGEVTAPGILSSGTQDGIGVADLLSTMKMHACGFYYCDEKFSHIHSEMEKVFLSLFLEILGPNEQMIFTTHNTDVLNMDLPLHTYAFLRRDPFDENAISCVYASEYIKKNNVSLRAAVENDLFSANPDTDRIIGLLNCEVEHGKE